MKTFTSGRLKVRKHTEEDFSGNYLSWLNDSEVMIHTDTSAKQYTPKDLKDYVQKEYEKGNTFLAVEDLASGMHIGNLKIYNIRNEGQERIAEYSRFIGEKSFWGLGYGKELGTLALNYCFNEMNIDKVVAGCRFENKKAIISNLKIGFNITGFKEYVVENKSDMARSLIFDLSKKDFIERSKKG
jgi:RimJ/RimL family protein N-acetyltransferase